MDKLRALALLLGIPSIAGCYGLYVLVIGGDGIVFATAASAITAFMMKAIFGRKEAK